MIFLFLLALLVRVSSLNPYQTSIFLPSLTDTYLFPSQAPAAALGPARVNLGTAGNFVLLAKTGISTVPESSIGECHFLRFFSP